MGPDTLTVLASNLGTVPSVMEPYRPYAWLVVKLIAAIDILGILTIFVERFFGGRGIIVANLGHIITFFSQLLFRKKNPVGISLSQLRSWHDVRKALLEGGKPPFDITGLNEVDLKERHPFSNWMVHEIVKKYENNVQGFAYLGAAVLIFVIGFRGIQYLTKEDSAFIVLALALEFTLIGILGLVIFYKPEDVKPAGNGGNEAPADRLSKVEDDLKKLQVTVKTVVDTLRNALPEP
jgi:hypothetical protein